MVLSIFQFATLSCGILAGLALHHCVVRVCLWIRARYMLRNLPRANDDATFFGVSKKFNSPYRHLAMLDLTSLGPGVYNRILTLQSVIISNPHLAAEVLEHPALTKPVRDIYKPFQKLIGSSEGAPDLITSLGGGADDMWKMLRKGLAPAFTVQNVRKGFPVIQSHGSHLTHVLASKGPKTPVDMSNALICVTIDSIAEWGFQLQWDAVESVAKSDQNRLAQVIRSANTHAARTFVDVWYRLFWWAQQYKDGAASVAAFHRVTKDIHNSILQRREALQNASNIAGHLLRIRDARGRPVSPRLMQAQIGALFWAGHDTTGHTMAWCLFAIASRPQVEARITAELASLGLLAQPSKPDPSQLTLDHLNQLPYLQAVIKETMRYHTIVPTVTSRINDRADTVFSTGFVLPRRTSVVVPQIGLHMSPLLFEEPQIFKPERWLESNADFIKLEASEGASSDGEAAASSSCCSSSFPGKARSAEGVEQSELRDRGFVRRFMPFSYGRRDCVGRTFAQMSVLTHLATLLSRFHFRLAEEIVGPPEQVERDQALRITLAPGKGMWMYAEPRWL
eukprot:jgi/Botrbrau1/18686/Bobra.0386s0014.1